MSENVCPHVGRACPCPWSHGSRVPHEYQCPFDGLGAADCPHPTLVLLRAAASRHPARLDYPHCHVEGCDWIRPALGDDTGTRVCGLLDKLKIDPPDASWEGIQDTPYWACGEARRAAANTVSDRCPHGDETCPCQDYGDPCHYEGTSTADPNHCPPGAWPCPNWPTGRRFRDRGSHCHVEGCDWSNVTGKDICGLAKIGVDPVHWISDDAVMMLDVLRGGPWWACGASRELAATIGRIPR